MPCVREQDALSSQQESAEAEKAAALEKQAIELTGTLEERLALKDREAKEVRVCVAGSSSTPLYLPLSCLLKYLLALSPSRPTDPLPRLLPHSGCPLTPLPAGEGGDSHQADGQAHHVQQHRQRMGGVERVGGGTH